MNTEIGTEAAQFPEKKGIHKWDFRCSAHEPDKSASPDRILDEGAEALGALVPAADGQHRLQLLVVRLQRCKPPIAA